jgi:hypothetical protein
MARTDAPDGAQPRRPKNPAFLDAARGFYAEAFEHRRKKDLARSMAEWSDLDDAEQRFTIAHLLYLNVHAQAAQIRALRQLRDLLSDLADGVEDALAGDQEDDGDDDSEEGDLVDGDDAESAHTDALDAPELPAGGVHADEPVVPEGA